MTENTSNVQFPINMYDPLRGIKKHAAEYQLAISLVATHGKFINGPEVKFLEDQLCIYNNSKYCITCGNGTDALHIALLALDVGPNDEVITVAHTWISTAEVISMIGAKPVFVDVEPDLFNIDPNKIEEFISSKTKAIIVVSLYGQMPDLELITNIAKKHNLPVIEDGAQSFGASQKFRRSGSVTTIGTTSFFPSKPLGCWGDGGACFTNDEKLAHKIRCIKNHGGSKRFCHEYIGMNSRLDSIQAALLNVKLKYFDDDVKLRNQVANRYAENLKFLEDNGLIKLPKIAPNNSHVWAQYAILLNDNEVREYMYEKLRENGVNIAIYYPKPLHQQPCFSYLGYKDEDLPVTTQVCETIINLPIYAELSMDEVDAVCSIFNKLLTNYSTDYLKI